MAGFFDRAATVATEAPVGLFVSSMWPTLFTSTTVARHGYHCWDTIDPATYRRRETTPDEVIGVPFWELLSDAGRRVAVLDVPHTRVRRPIDGVMLVEWGCHDRHFGTHSWPAALVGEINERVGPHPIGCAELGRSQFAPCDYLFRVGATRTPDEEVALFEQLLVGIDRKEQVSLDLLGQGGWDLFLTVFGESHCVGHQLWKVSDPLHPWHDPVVAARLGDPIRRIYQRLDQALARHLEVVGPEATVVVHLSHGMAAHYDGTHLLQEILTRLEARAEGGSGLGWRTRAVDAATRRLPRPIRRPLLGAAAAARRRVAGELPAPDDGAYVEEWTQGPERLWFQAPNNTVSGGIRLNVVGREGAGRIPAEERRRTAEWLRDELLQIVNLDTCRPAIREVLLTDEVLERPVSDALPDLLIEWDHTAMIERIWSPAIGSLARAYTHWRTGDHTREGLLAVAGEGIAAGVRPGVLETVDIAPTVAATIGEELPGVDGRPRLDLLDGTSRRPALEAPPWRTATPAERAAVRMANSFEALRRRVDGLAGAHHVTRTIATSAVDRSVELDRELARLRDEVGGLRAHLDAVEARLRAELSGAGERAQRLEAIHAATAWVAHLPPQSDLLVSVIMPTRDRVGRLAQAIASVQSQRHTRWELLVVDDGSVDATADYLFELDDPRIRTLRADGRGCSAARNLALDVAAGDVIAYLDDDNRFHPDWLVAVAWAFEALPDLRVAYGARVIEDEARAVGLPASGRPMLQLNPWDRATVERANTLDMNVLAHRPSPARFDERVTYFGDWDLVLKLSEQTEPMLLPVIAALYATSSERRMSDLITDEEKRREADLVREAVATRSRARRRTG